MSKQHFLFGFAIVVAFAACTGKNVISPVSGAIDGRPAISLYGTSYLPTDYVLIDTAAAYHKISYEGVVYKYNYITSSGSTIFLTSAGAASARATLLFKPAKILLTVDTTYEVLFGSKLYSSH